MGWKDLGFWRQEDVEELRFLSSSADSHNSYLTSNDIESADRLGSLKRANLSFTSLKCHCDMSNCSCKIEP